MNHFIKDAIILIIAVIAFVMLFHYIRNNTDYIKDDYINVNINVNIKEKLTVDLPEEAELITKDSNIEGFIRNDTLFIRFKHNY